MQIWSQVYLNDPGSMLCLMEERMWSRAQEEIDGHRLIAEIRVGDRVVYSAVGSPIAPQEGGGDRLFAPAWILSQLGVEGGGEEAEISWRSEEFFPEATRIVLRPHDSAFYHADAKEELERALTHLGILQLGSTIRVPLEVLGGYEIEFDVVVTEPANLVLMQGDEVALEFEEALDGAAEAQGGSPPPLEEPEPFVEEPMIPEALSGHVVSGHVLGGHVLGGEPSKRMADGRAWNPWRS